MNLNNILEINGKEVEFVVNKEKIKMLELKTGKGIINLFQDLGLNTIEAMFTQFVCEEKDKAKLFSEAIEEYGITELFQFLTNQIQAQAGFLFR